MEALQMLKFLLKKRCLEFMQGWSTSQHLLVEDEPSACDVEQWVQYSLRTSAINTINAIMDNEEHIDISKKIDVFE